MLLLQPQQAHELEHAGTWEMFRPEVGRVALTRRFLQYYILRSDVMLEPQRRGVDVPHLASSSPAANANGGRRIWFQHQRELAMCEVVGETFHP